MTLGRRPVRLSRGAVVGTLVAWAKLSPERSSSAALADGYTTVLRGIPDLLVIYLFYFGGSAALSAIGNLFGAEGSSACRPSSPARSPSASCPAPIRRRSSAAPTRRQPRRARGRALRGHASLAACSAASSRRRFCATRIPGLGNTWQLVLKESALISVTGLVELLRQSHIARRLDAPPVRFLHHGGHPLPRHHLGFDLSVPARGAALDAWHPEGFLMDFAFMRDTLLHAARRRAADAEPRLHVRRARRRPRHAPGAHADVGFQGARLAGPSLCLRLPRHAAARADLPDLLRPRAVPPDAAGMGVVDLLPRALLVRGSRADPEHGGLCQRDHPRRPAIGAAQSGRGGAGLRHVRVPALPPHRLPDRACARRFPPTAARSSSW